MAVEKENTLIEQIQELKQYLPNKTQEELDDIFAYGEEKKAEGERKKKEFWISHDRDDFLKLLHYKRKNKEVIRGQYKYLDKLDGLERERFIKECLHDDILYSGELDEKEVEGKEYSYKDWKEGNVVMEEGVYLYFGYNYIGAKGVKAIAEKMELKEGVKLILAKNGIGAEGAKAIAENMKLKEWVYLNLEKNDIGAEGAKAISYMELKEGVELDLMQNQIGAEGAKAIAENMALKEGVSLHLGSNEIGADGAKAMAEKMELKEGVKLNLGYNGIGDEGAEAIAENMKLKEGVYLYLGGNAIGDEGAEVIMKNMELKEGVTLDLQYNSISDGMKQKLKEWEQIYVNNGINCKVLVY